jgi:PhzF family phenazine biosynthesis protein
MIKVKIINSFTFEGRGGNPAGVVYIQGDFPDAHQMQTIAGIINLSETAFVRSTGDNGYAMRYFTPEAEVPLCGHATLAACYERYTAGDLKSSLIPIETGAGLINVTLKTAPDGSTYFWMAQPEPVFEPVSQADYAKICDSFYALSPASELPLCIGSTGLRDIIVPVESRSALNAVQLRPAALAAVSKTLKVTGAHLFAIEGAQVYARNFAPLYGIDEESATGTSNGVLIAYLQRYAANLFKSPDPLHRSLEITVFQGERMGKLSQILTRVDDDGTCQHPYVGGSCADDHIVYLCDFSID